MDSKSMHITMERFCEADVKWLPIPETNGVKRKYHIDMAGDTPPDDVDTLLRVLIAYNSSYRLDSEAEKDVLLEQMCRQMDRRRLTLPGGIRFADNKQQIYPGCCSGVEEWMKTAQELEKHDSPWMGHDPDVSFLEKDSLCYIADVKLTRHPTVKPAKKRYGGSERVWIGDALRDENIKVITWKLEEFHSQLDKLDRDFKEFVEGPLRERMGQLSKTWAGNFARAFARNFRYNENADNNSVKLIL